MPWPPPIAAAWPAAPAAPRVPRCGALLRAAAPTAAPPAGAAARVVAPFPPVGKPKLRYSGVPGAVVGLADGINVQKPALMANCAEQQLPAPPISKSDDEFLEGLGVEFVWGAEGVDVGELNDLFEKVGFPRRDPGRLTLALANTYRTVWVRAARKSRVAKQGQLLGFARATSDGALSAVIWDVSVAPAWQRSGLGRALMERLTASLVHDGIATITLYAEPNVVALYEKLGFVADPDGVRGVAYQRSKLARGLASGLLGRR
ncbi:hypothetical protein COHA_002592 [Chlorella ohadii]|uniref:N-acetyltransferase domain-containing protein n=1 Tax=Chlorella ohadii TaxID=2649997 RepID=A0AAD5H7D7_9CHLO|nr:hypothetical protein COHA_002592 [Chlorella ohadii]